MIQTVRIRVQTDLVLNVISDTFIVWMQEDAIK